MESSNSSLDSAAKDQLIGRVVEEYFQAKEAGQNPQLNDFVERYPEISDVLKSVIPAMQASEPNEGKRPSEDRILGDFRILRQIGRGGMGVVYQAEQISMRRHVALKVLPLAGLLDAPKILRFQSEVRAVASLDHPNIVSVYSVGEERGTHFFAMQLIRGSSLSEVIRALRCMRDGKPGPQDATSEIANSIAAGGNFSVSATEDFDSEIESKLDKNETILENNSSTIPSRTRREYFGGIVTLMVQAAEALEHAHGRGIVHRDIKPANLLLDAQARLYVTDFGLAQIEADAGVTMTGDLLGTLRYMAPEQTLAKRVVIDHRADVYSLGATLYELLALQPAFPSSDRHELLKQVAFEEPKQLRRIDSTIPAELETIVQKAMSKDRDERYESSKAFGEDLTRYLEHRPILARRPSVIQVISKWIGRNPTVTLGSLLALAFFAVLFGISSSLIAWQRDRAEAQFQRARVIRLASESRALSTERPSLSMLFAIEAHQRSQREQVAKAYAHEALLNASHALPRTHTLKVGGPPVASVLMAKRWLVMLGEGRVRLLDLSSTSAPPIELCDAGVDSMVLSDDRRWLVTIGDVIQRWDLDSPKSSIAISVDPVVGGVQPVSLSSDGGVLAIIEKDGTASVWDCSTAQPKRLRAITHPNEKIHFVNVSSDGSFVIAAAENSEPFALLWRLDDSNSEPRILDGHEGPVVDFRQPRNGREFATLDRKRMIVRDLSNLEAPAIRTVQFDGHYASDRILSTDFSKLFLRQKYTSRLYGFDLSADDPKATVSQLKGHSVDVSHIEFAHDGKTLISSARDGTVRFWDVTSWPPTSTRVLRAQDAVQSLAMHDDGRWMATVGVDGTTRLWDLRRPESSDPLYVLNGLDDYSFSSTAISSTGRWMATTAQNNQLQLWDVDAKQSTEFSRVLDYPTVGFGEVAISSNDRWFIASGHDSSLHIWDLTAEDFDASKRILPAPQDLSGVAGDNSPKLTVGPNSRWLAVSYSNHARLWDLAAREPSVVNVNGLGDEIISLAFSPDGRWFVTGARDSLRIWDLNASELNKSGVLLREDVGVWSVGFDQQGRYLYAVAGRDVERWDLNDLAAKPFVINPHQDDWHIIWRMAVSNNNEWMVTTRFSRNAQLWDLRGREPTPYFMPTHLGIQSVAFSPDNRWLVTGSLTNARLWDLTAEDPIASARVLRGHRENIWSVAFSADSNWLVTDASDGKIRRWCLDTPWLIEDALQIVGRELTAEERERYDLADKD